MLISLAFNNYLLSISAYSGMAHPCSLAKTAPAWCEVFFLFFSFLYSFSSKKLREGGGAGMALPIKPSLLRWEKRQAGSLGREKLLADWADPRYVLSFCFLPSVSAALAVACAVCVMSLEPLLRASFSAEIWDLPCGDGQAAASQIFSSPFELIYKCRDFF